MTIECIARAIIIDGPFILLNQPLDRSYSYLPGGHIEAGENASQALLRELEEEGGISAQITRFLGVEEHFWTNKHGHTHHEFNFMFLVSAAGITHTLTPASKEDHIIFTWARLDDLDSVILYPSALRKNITEWIAKKSFLYTNRQ